MRRLAALVQLVGRQLVGRYLAVGFGWVKVQLVGRQLVGRQLVRRYLAAGFGWAKVQLGQLVGLARHQLRRLGEELRHPGEGAEAVAQRLRPQGV